MSEFGIFRSSKFPESDARFSENLREIKLLRCYNTSTVLMKSTLKKTRHSQSKTSY